MSLQRMNATMQGVLGILCLGLLPACTQGGGPLKVGNSRAALSGPNPTSDNDPTGVISTFSTAGAVDNDNPFFASLGTNGRTCNSCHKQDQAWSVSAVQIQATFNDSDGLDPIFRLVDGANRPDADVSTVDARMEAYSLLLQRGLIRVGDGMQVPGGADFVVDSVTDPYGYATTSRFSFFRRPLPSTSVRFLTQVMWDGRETLSTVDASLRHQANDATLGHAQAAQSITPEQATAIAAFQEGIFTAQRNGQGVGTTQAQDANGGPEYLAGLQSSTTQAGLMGLYTAWTSVASPHRRAVASGQALFNGAGLINHNTGAAFACTGCHNVADVGNRVSTQNAFVDLNLTDAVDQGSVNLPVYTVRRLSDNATRKVTDLGRSTITGLYADVGKFKVPVLRGLAARGPYFHNGSRTTLADVVTFYDGHFNLQLTDQQKSDSAAFLQVL